MGLVVASVLAVALLASTVTFALLWRGQEGRADDARSELATLRQKQADDARATGIAAKYALGASTFDYRDLTPWRTALVTGVTPGLKTKLDTTADAMAPLLQSLRWVSTGSGPVASVIDRAGSIYKVAVFLEVAATTTEAPAGRAAVSRYDVTLDAAHDWVITDVGGTAAPK